MKYSSVSIYILCVWTTHVLSSSFDFGNFDQYNFRAAEEKPEGLKPYSIWVDRTDNGNSYILGAEVRSRFVELQKRCDAKVDNGCFQDAAKIIQNAPLVTHPDLDKRMIVARNPVVLAYAGIVAIVAILSELWILHQKSEDQVIYEPATFDVSDTVAENFKEQVVEITTSVTLSLGGTAVATVTKPGEPDTPTITATATPSAEVVHDEEDDQEDELLDINLEPEYLQRLTDWMAMHQNCPDGAKFDKEHPSEEPSRFRARQPRPGRNTLGGRICAVGGAISQINPHGIGDVLAQLQTRFRVVVGDIVWDAAGGAAAESLRQVLTFAEASYPILAQGANARLPALADPGTLGGVAVVLWIIGEVMKEAFDPTKQIIYHLKNLPKPVRDHLLEESVEAPASTKTAAPTVSTGNCPKQSEVPCGDEEALCKLELRHSKDRKTTDTVCKDSDFKGCPCRPMDSNMMVHQISESFFKYFPWDGLKETIDDRGDDNDGKPKAECMDREVMDLEIGDFEKIATKMLDEICARDLKDIQGTSEPLVLKQKVDGEKKEMEYRWSTGMTWRPGTKRDCKPECNKKEVIEAMKTCSEKKGDKTYMHHKVGLDVACGNFRFMNDLVNKEEVESTPPPEQKDVDRWGSAMDNIDTNLRSWTCKTREFGLIFGSQQRCVCSYTGREKCEGCDNKSLSAIFAAVNHVPVDADNGFGCELSTDCSTCRPPELVCVAREDCGGKITQCPQCQRTHIGDGKSHVVTGKFEL